jgi:molybdopterin-guanine dinucleotide biosynthesis protein B
MKPIICFVGRSNSGKTTLVSALISSLRALGLKVGTIKHAANGFQFFKGKDSSLHKLSGASVSIVASPNMLGILMDTESDKNPMELMKYMEGVDIVLAEGYKSSDLPKIEVFVPKKLGDLPLCINDPKLLAIVTKETLDTQLPLFDPQDIKGLTDFILKVTALNASAPQTAPETKAPR